MLVRTAHKQWDCRTLTNCAVTREAIVASVAIVEMAWKRMTDDV